MNVDKRILKSPQFMKEVYCVRCGLGILAMVLCLILKERFGKLKERIWNVLVKFWDFLNHVVRTLCLFTQRIYQATYKHRYVRTLERTSLPNYQSKYQHSHLAWRNTIILN